MEINFLISHVFLLVCFISVTEQGRVKRCYVCRSRGDLGDCRDPFPYNATTVEEVRAVDATPCASGWCAKIVEGKGDEYAIATERMCLQRPPGDEEQRCAPTLYRNRKVFMCFCKGDLCNGVGSRRPSYALLLLTTIGFGFYKYIDFSFL